jgi:hypothetical protein
MCNPLSALPNFIISTMHLMFVSRHYQKTTSNGSGTGSTQPLEYNWVKITTEELLGRESSGSCLENREYGRRDPSRWPRGTLYPQKLAVTSPPSGGRSVGIVRSRTQTMEFSFMHLMFTRHAIIRLHCAYNRNDEWYCHAIECLYTVFWLIIGFVGLLNNS